MFWGRRVTASNNYYGISKNSAEPIIDLDSIDVLVAPYRQVPRFTELTSEEVCDIMISAQKIGKVIEKEYKSDSLTIAIQDGPAAGQTVKIVIDINRLLNTPLNLSFSLNNRKPRSLEEMAKEAEYLGKFFIDENSN
ncbi:8172_t:CDS:2 [Entrophospora sp. SA101]|nr:8172_t:CDS:2 [Entrophospora sp. SA101]